MTSQAIIDAAREHLTRAQYDAWRLELAGNGTRRIALLLDISRAAAIDRLDNAYRTLRRNNIHQDASGHWYQDASVRAQEATRREDTLQTGEPMGQPVETRGNAYRRKDSPA